MLKKRLLKPFAAGTCSACSGLLWGSVFLLLWKLLAVPWAPCAWHQESRLSWYRVLSQPDDLSSSYWEWGKVWLSAELIPGEFTLWHSPAFCSSWNAVAVTLLEQAFHQCWPQPTGSSWTFAVPVQGLRDLWTFVFLLLHQRLCCPWSLVFFPWGAHLIINIGGVGF